MCEKIPGAPLVVELEYASPSPGERIPTPVRAPARNDKLWKYLLALLPPLALSALFYLLKSNTALMDGWVTNILAPVMQTVGKGFSLFPFSVAELLAVLFVVGTVVWLARTLVLLVRRQGKAVLRRILAFGCVLLWLWTAFCWLWNCTYYATGFADKHGLSKYPYTPDQLLTVTVYFAYQAAQLSDDVPRGEDLSYATPKAELFDRALDVYDNISKVYPDLALSERKAKGLVFSRLQSILGYTGIYFPFTGEANVNVDQSACIVPFTIAHEMAHQRFVAAEEECNFLGLMACISSDDVVFQYAGYLMGLIYLTNALYELSPELVDEIMAQSFTPELTKDWQENYDYWQELKSPSREKANEAMDEVYDGYLKSQGQSLGLMSYSACVDLLVNYFYYGAGQ